MENFDKYILDLLAKYELKANTIQTDAGSSFIQVQHFFIKDNKNYAIFDLQREKGFSHESLSRLFNVQIQFNSLAPSTPSVKLTETVSSSAVSDSVSIVSKVSANISANISNNSSVSNTKPLITDSEYDDVVLEECGLTIKIDKKLNLKTYKNYAGSKTRLDFLDKDFHGAGAHYAI